MLVGETVNNPLSKTGSELQYISKLIDSRAGTFSVAALPFSGNIRNIELVAFSIGTQIPSSSYKLQQYIPAEVERTADGFIMRCHSIDEEAYGNTYEEAYFDFLTSIRDHYESLRKREGRLSDRDQDVLKKFRLLLQTN